jgi:hypothetical protein
MEVNGGNIMYALLFLSPYYFNINSLIMKLQLENYEYKYTVETPHNDLEIDEYIQLFKGLLVTATFTEKQFNNAILELAEEVKQEKEKGL